MSGSIKHQERVDALTEKLNALMATAIEAEPLKPPEQTLVWDYVLSDGNPDSRSWVVPPRQSNTLQKPPRMTGETELARLLVANTDSGDDSEYQDVLDSQPYEEEFHDYLKELHTHIVAKLRAPPTGYTPDLRPDITLQKHQMHAVGKVELEMNSQLKGMILVDPLVTSLPYCQQWMEEINKFFNDHACLLPRSQQSSLATELARNRANVDDIFRYKIIVTSYHKVSAELGRLRQSFKRIWVYHNGRLPYEDLPKRPTVTLLSGVFNLRG